MRRYLFIILPLVALWSSPGAIAAAPSEQAYDLPTHKILSQVVLLVSENYVDRERIKPAEMLHSALDAVQRQVAEVLIFEDQGGKTLTVQLGEAHKVFKVEGIDTVYEVSFKLSEIFRFITEHLTRKDKLKDVEYAATNGLLSTLDPHTVLLIPEVYREMQIGTKGEFGGLGIVISIREGRLTVIAPLEDTPAWRAGLKARDHIVKIGVQSTAGMTLTEAVNRLRGKPGTQVTIWVMRKGWSESRKFTITRANIQIKSVKSRMLAGKIGHIKIKSFQSHTHDHLLKHIRTLQQEGMKGLILDLRGNPGGLLEHAVKVSDTFLDAGVIVTTVGRKDKLVNKARQKGSFTDLPVVVLVDEGSASASEIVSGALKNNDRGLVIGRQTFGKGTVQMLFPIPDKPTKSALKLTVAKYLTPGDISIQSVGIMPDIMVHPAVIDRRRIELFSIGNRMREQDLKKHLEGEQPPPSKKPQTAKAALEIAYLDEEAVIEGKEKEKEEYPPPDEFVEDFMITLAADLLRTTTERKRTPLLARASSFIASRIKVEDEKIARALGKLGIDWVEVSDSRPSKPEIGFQLIDAQPPTIAGDKVELALKVRNPGPGTLYQLRAISEAKTPLFDNLEFVFGKLSPGEEQEWQVPIKIPKDALRRVDQVTFTLGDAGGQALPAITVEIAIEELPRPAFTFAYRVDDPPPGGNGDGRLQRGEQAELVVAVGNRGAGPALETLVVLKNQAIEDVYLESGRQVLGELAPGAKAEARFALKLRQQAKQPDEEIAFELSIMDNVLGEFLLDHLDLLSLSPTLAPNSPPEIEVSVSVPGLKDPRIVDQARIDLRGVANDNNQLQDLYVFANDRKVFFKSAECGAPTGKVTQEMSFHTSIELKEGQNRITVVARENDTLWSQRTMLINRRPATPAAGAAEKQAAGK